MSSPVISLLLLALLLAVSTTSARQDPELKQLFREQFEELIDTVDGGRNREFVVLFGGQPTKKAVREARKLVDSFSGNEYEIGKVTKSHGKLIGMVTVFNGESTPHKCRVVLTKSATSPTGYKFSEIEPLDGKKRKFWGALITFASVAVNLVTLVMFPGA